MKNLETLRKKSTSEITAEEWEFLRNAGVCNGCGGKDCVISHFLASIIAPIFFWASCDKHDFGYWKGGDEARRKECDEKFLEAILWDIYILYEYKKRKEKYKLFKKIYYQIIAYLFYFSVRIGGKKYFYYH